MHSQKSELMISSQDIELSWVLLHDKVLCCECWVHPQAEVCWVEVCRCGLEISSVLPDSRWNEHEMKMKVISILGLIQMTWAQLFLENFRFSCLLPHQHCHRGRHQNGKYMFFGEGVHVGRPGKASSFLMRAGTWIWHSGQRFGIWSLDEMWLPVLFVHGLCRLCGSLIKGISFSLHHCRETQSWCLWVRRWMWRGKRCLQHLPFCWSK